MSRKYRYTDFLMSILTFGVVWVPALIIPYLVTHRTLLTLDYSQIKTWILLVPFALCLPLIRCAFTNLAIDERGFTYRKYGYISKVKIIFFPHDNVKGFYINHGAKMTHTMVLFKRGGSLPMEGIGTKRFLRFILRFYEAEGVAVKVIRGSAASTVTPMKRGAAETTSDAEDDYFNE